MGKGRLVAVRIDEETLGVSGPDAEHERRVAIFDLIEENSFDLPGDDQGPYVLTLSQQERRLIFAISSEAGAQVHTFIMSMAPFRGVIRDYFNICDSYYEAIRSSTTHQIEAIDMARRGIHNEGSELLKERLEGKVEMDFQTARRLFTLICALHAGQGRAPGA